MRNLFILLVLFIGLTSCAKPPQVIESDIEICISDECRLEKLTEYCSYHGGLREFSNIDEEHYYAVCNDNTYVVVSYEEMSTFVLDLDNF